MQRAGQGAGPWDYGLAFLVDADAYPLRLGPIHRVIPHLDPAEAASLAAQAFTVTELPATGAGRDSAPSSWRRAGRRRTWAATARRSCWPGGAACG
jgi:hypothetical protein